MIDTSFNNVALEIQFLEEDYRSFEPDLAMSVEVRKRSRIATPVTVRVLPVTLTQFRATGRPDPPGILLFYEGRFSPIEAGQS